MGDVLSSVGQFFTGGATVGKLLGGGSSGAGPRPKPKSLDELDAELASLGYKGGPAPGSAPAPNPLTDIGKPKVEGNPLLNIGRSTPAPNPLADLSSRTSGRMGLSGNDARIGELLGMRQSFLDEEARKNAKSPRSRASTAMTGAQGVLSSPNLASRTLLA